ncbi:hypothetical protein L4C34_19410 [Vibrio profundum]|uniref:hypothetical protein n=1 Tax=Vibrio profundum TaxID=2910247 RepID=UPI003D10402E
MSFENRIFYSEVIGASNDEAAKAWFKDMRQTIQKPIHGGTEPWVTLFDGRNWGTASPDAMENNSKSVVWMSKNNCLLCAIVLSKKLQQFSMSKQISNHTLVQFYFDYDEAYQACLDKLAAAQSPHHK